MGYVNEDHVLGLDTGCVWGGTLTGQRIDTNAAEPVQVPSHSAGLPLED
jgi:bis(5'-nucleosyl)-tetraphosphatase (symmetrical)